MTPVPGGVDRRRLMLGAAGLGAVALAQACAPSPTAKGSGALKVSTYGGNFEQAMSQHVYPVFEKATGIKVQSIAQPAGLQFLLQLIQANRAGMAPMDLCISAAMDMNRGRTAGIWRVRGKRGKFPGEWGWRGLGFVIHPMDAGAAL